MHEVKSFETFDVLFGAGGFDPSNTHLIFSRQRHTAEYGAPKDSVFAEIVTGRQILFTLSRDDSILNIKPIIKWIRLSNKAFTTDLSTLENGEWDIYLFEAELSRDSPIGAEQFYALTRERTLTVDVFTSSFIWMIALKENLFHTKILSRGAR